MVNTTPRANGPLWGWQFNEESLSELLTDIYSHSIVLGDNNYPRLPGETDDTGRFNRALSDALSTGAALLIPGKTYQVSSKLSLDPSTVMIGAGLQKTIINSSASDIAIDFACTTAVFAEAGLIGNFTLNNNGTSQSNVGLRLSNVFKATVLNMTITNFGVNLQLQNHNNGWTEGTRLENVHLSSAYIDEFQLDPSSGTVSFGYSNLEKVFINVTRNGVNGIHIKPSGYLYNGVLNAVIWLDTSLSNACYFKNEGTVKQMEMDIVGEVPGASNIQTSVINTGDYMLNNANFFLDSHPNITGYTPNTQTSHRQKFKSGNAMLLKLGHLPPDSSNAFDQLEIDIKGGAWTANGKGHDIFIIGNRGGIDALWQQVIKQTNVTLQVYQESDNSFTVYLSSITWSAFTVEVDGFGQDGNYPGTPDANFRFGIADVSGTTPTGTKVYDSSTATPTITG